MNLGVKLGTKTLLESANLADRIDGPILQGISQELLTLVNGDLDGRGEWDRMMADSLKMVMQLVEKRAAPFKGQANVKFPLLTVAALNYHSRAYPALVQGNDLVVMRPAVSDIDGSKQEVATRVAAHMSYQLLEEQPYWEEDTDKALICQPILGCAFKKVRWDRDLGTTRSDLIYPQHLIVPYYTRRLQEATRISHALEFTSNDIHERVEAGLFLPCDYEPTPQMSTSAIETQVRRSQGTQPSGEDKYQPQAAYEIHVGLDLDDDGYCEPYAVTINATSGHVYRIVAQYYESDLTYSVRNPKRIARINKNCPFIKYPFIPSPDGGFYDMGFWSLLLPVNAAINTGVNQLLDAGTKQNSGGGFLGRGVKLAGGATTVTIGEWMRTESSGPQLRDNIVPHQHPTPSPTLMQLISLLIGYGEKVGMSTEAVSGADLGQNTPASTAQTMNEGGMAVFNGVYKRTHRAMGEEFRAIFRTNQIYLGTSRTFNDLVDSNSMSISLRDYQTATGTIRPAADPHVATDSVRVGQAGLIAQMSAQGPGFDSYQVNKRLLKAMRVSNIDEVLPDPKGPNKLPDPPPDPRIVTGELRAKTTILRVKVQAELKALQLAQTVEVNRAKIANLEAQSMKVMAEAEAIGDRVSLDALKARIQALKDANIQMNETAQFVHDLAGGMDEGAADEEPGFDLRPAIDSSGLSELVPAPVLPAPEAVPEPEVFGPPGVPQRGRPLELGLGL